MDGRGQTRLCCVINKCIIPCCDGEITDRLGLVETNVSRNPIHIHHRPSPQRPPGSTGVDASDHRARRCLLPTKIYPCSVPGGWWLGPFPHRDEAIVCHLNRHITHSQHHQPATAMAASDGPRDVQKRLVLNAFVMMCRSNQDAAVLSPDRTSMLTPLLLLRASVLASGADEGISN